MDVHAALDQLDETLSALDELDLTRLEVGEQAALITRLHTAERRAAGLKACAAAAFEQRVGWKADGARSGKQWLADRLGMDRPSAARLAGIARRLGQLPATAAALRAGRLGLDDAATLASAVDADPAGAGQLDAIAAAAAAEGSTHSQLVRAVRAWQTTSPDATDHETRLWQRRRAAVGRDADGAVTVSAVLDPHAGEYVLAAMQRFAKPDDRRDQRSQAQRNADALALIARLALRADADQPLASSRPTVAVHVRAADLAAGHGPAETHHTGPVTAATARIMGCDANVHTIIVDDHATPMDVGRARATPSKRLRLAVHARDRACVGCGSRLGLQLHHIRHWANGGPTNLANLTLLCWSCHNSLHRYGWHITRRPDGRYKLIKSPLPGG